MARINENYLKLKAGYLFPEISRRVARFQETHPDAQIIRLGIGDVVLPLPPSVRARMHEAIDELGAEETFRGYGPEQGYPFLREAIAREEFQKRGAEVSADEIFVSDGSKCDSGNIQEIFDTGASIAVPDPVYPVYVDTNVMAGRSGEADASGRYAGIVYLPCTSENGFLPTPPAHACDLVYLCSPNNPTGAVLDRPALQAWIDYAREADAVLLFDAAYADYIQDPELPHSIFELPGARDCAIEFRSFSKSVGFTGVRCAYVVIPKQLMGKDAAGNPVSLHALWNRRHATKFNGASYPVQAGAAASFTPEGRAEVRERVEYYLENAQLIRSGLQKAGYHVFSGVHAPYLWLETPNRKPSWEFFDDLLERAHVVGTPGSGFGSCGEGYFRLSAFGKRERIEEAVERILKL